MAKVKSPLLSLSGSGQIAKSQVYASWRGVPYVRQHVIPNNPQTTAQTATRSVFRTLSDMFKRMGPLARAPFEAFASGKPLTPRNAVVKTDLPVLRGQVDFTSWIGSPGAGGGLTPVLLTLDDSVAGEITATLDISAAPTDWSVDSAVFTLFEDQDPALDFSQFIQEDEDVTAVAGGQGTATFNGLTAAQVYIVAAWVKWTRPDGKTAYGQSLTDSVAAT